MSKEFPLDELVRDLTSVDCRTKSNTREILEEYNFYPHSVSEWARIGKERGYFEYYNLREPE